MTLVERLTSALEAGSHAAPELLTGDMTGLDAKADDPGFAVFGRVVEGMDVVRAIWMAPRSATKGEGVMKGEMLEPVVKILTVRRAPVPAPAISPPR